MFDRVRSRRIIPARAPFERVRYLLRNQQRFVERDRTARDTLRRPRRA
jgi:hypothetical protein